MKKTFTQSDALKQWQGHATSAFLVSIRAIFEQLSYKVEIDYVNQLHAIAVKGQPSDRQLFSVIEQLCFDAILDEPTTLGPMSADILLSSVCHYYELTGLFSNALSGQLKVLSFSRLSENLILQRRAHNCLGSSYVRFCDFKKACEHLEQACRVALQINNRFYVFASLSNAVALFKSMGLLEAARNLSLRLISQPSDGENYNHIHLVNANNGLSTCLALGDLENAQLFYHIAKDRINKCGSFLTKLNVAYFESASIILMAMQGDLEGALSRGEKYLSSVKESSGIRIEILTACAIAEVRLALNDRSAIRDSCGVLECLLESAEGLPTHYEEILRLLIRLYSASVELGFEEDSEKIVSYLRRLREYLVGTKHRVFFEEQLEGLTEAVDESLTLMNPSYKVPSWIAHIQANVVGDLSNNDKEEFVQACEIDVLPLFIAKLSGNKREMLLRSSEYDVAENWAVAADIALGSDGKHGFRVGRLASSLALKLGFSSNDATQVELAARLHNIGHIAMFVRQEVALDWRERGTFSSFCQHVNIGRKLLGRFPGATLKLSSIIAGSHHEWWNGGGYPFGLKHDAIPLEGRLCTVADTFIRLLKPEIGKQPFSLTRAQDQLVAMSGVQLDPNLVQLLLEFLKENVELNPVGHQPKVLRSKSAQAFAKPDNIRGVLELTSCL